MQAPCITTGKLCWKLAGGDPCKKLECINCFLRCAVANHPTPLPKLTIRQVTELKQNREKNKKQKEGAVCVSNMHGHWAKSLISVALISRPWIRSLVRLFKPVIQTQIFAQSCVPVCYHCHFSPFCFRIRPNHRSRIHENLCGILFGIILWEKFWNLHFVFNASDASRSSWGAFESCIPFKMIQD